MTVSSSRLSLGYSTWPQVCKSGALKAEDHGHPGLGSVSAMLGRSLSTNNSDSVGADGSNYWH